MVENSNQAEIFLHLILNRGKSMIKYFIKCLACFYVRRNFNATNKNEITSACCGAGAGAARSRIIWSEPQRDAAPAQAPTAPAPTAPAPTMASIMVRNLK
jgi:hypothetical protein